MSWVNLDLQGNTELHFWKEAMVGDQYIYFGEPGGSSNDSVSSETLVDHPIEKWKTG